MDMHRRNLLRIVGSATAGLGAVGVASAYDEEDDDAGNEGSCNPESQEHPVECAMTFTWYDGRDYRIDAGPMVLLNMNEASKHDGFLARREVANNANEYAKYIYNSHEAWREYSSVERIGAEIRQHYPYSPDPVAGIVIWEHGFGVPDDQPDDWDYSCEDFESWFTVDNVCG